MAQAKNKAVFYCQNCGYESTKWMGQCPGCKEWNTFVEEVVTAASSKNIGKGITARGNAPAVLADITIQEEARLQTRIVELDRVLGGGIVQGSLTLVGGDPGIGKSTLLLQTCRQIAEDGHKVLYISGEESQVQIKMRADRIGTFTSNMLLLCETNLDNISEVIRRESPKIVVIDSIQTMYNESVSAAPGSVS
ncbi:MAG: AAA family ATPase, partial [Acetatifactor sp.]|nr:AAA family ATPase [Acetatifactor sp.]